MIECKPLDAGTKRELQTAVATARALVFEMGSTTPWLTDDYQDLQYTITDRVVNGAPVWEDEDSDGVMYRAVDGEMKCGHEESCDAGNGPGWFVHTTLTSNVLAPTQLSSDQWISAKVATLEPQFTSAREEGSAWVDVPDMRITAVHGLHDAEPSMAAALRQLAAL